MKYHNLFETHQNVHVYAGHAQRELSGQGFHNRDIISSILDRSTASYISCLTYNVDIDCSFANYPALGLLNMIFKTVGVGVIKNHHYYGLVHHVQVKICGTSSTTDDNLGPRTFIHQIKELVDSKDNFGNLLSLVINRSKIL